MKKRQFAKPKITTMTNPQRGFMHGDVKSLNGRKNQRSRDE
jgi:hypothetical protein